jgi:hypothetical protein
MGLFADVAGRDILPPADPLGEHFLDGALVCLGFLLAALIIMFLATAASAPSGRRNR